MGSGCDRPPVTRVRGGRLWLGPPAWPLVSGSGLWTGTARLDRGEWMWALAWDRLPGPCWGRWALAWDGPSGPVECRWALAGTVRLAPRFACGLWPGTTRQTLGEWRRATAGPARLAPGLACGLWLGRPAWPWREWWWALSGTSLLAPGLVEVGSGLGLPAWPRVCGGGLGLGPPTWPESVELGSGLGPPASPRVSGGVL